MSALAEFRHLVDQAWEYVHASSFAALSDHLAKLLPDIEVAVRHAPAADRVELHSLRARSYQAAAASFTRQDQADAAWVAADRALQAAEMAGQPLEVVAGLFRMAHAFGVRQQHMTRPNKPQSRRSKSWTHGQKTPPAHQRNCRFLAP